MCAADFPTVSLGKSYSLKIGSKISLLFIVVPTPQTEMVWGAWGDTGYQ